MSEGPKEWSPRDYAIRSFGRVVFRIDALSRPGYFASVATGLPIELPDAGEPAGEDAKYVEGSSISVLSKKLYAVARVIKQRPLGKIEHGLLCRILDDVLANADFSKEAISDPKLLRDAVAELRELASVL